MSKKQKRILIRILIAAALTAGAWLAPLDGVVSTATHFVLSRYKDRGVIISGPVQDERGNVSL